MIFKNAVKLRDEQERGTLDRARVYVAGQSLRDLKTEDEARARVNRYADAKVDIIKIHVTGGPNDMTPAVYGALIDQAHKRGLRVAAHLYALSALGNRNSLSSYIRIVVILLIRGTTTWKLS